MSVPDSGLVGADGSSEEGRLAVLECKQPIFLSFFSFVSLQKVFEQICFPTKIRTLDGKQRLKDKSFKLRGFFLTGLLD